MNARTTATSDAEERQRLVLSRDLFDALEGLSRAHSDFNTAVARSAKPDELLRLSGAEQTAANKVVAAYRAVRRYALTDQES